MHAALCRNLFLVKEHIGVFKAANNYDIYDPNTDLKTLECRETNLGILTKIFRFTNFKAFTAFHLEIHTPEGQKVLTVKRGFALFLSTVQVLDENDVLVGTFKQKLTMNAAKYDVLDVHDNTVCTLAGNWNGMAMRFMQGETELAQLARGYDLVRRLLTADNYVLTIHDTVAANDTVRILIVAAVICSDMVNDGL